VRSPAAFLEDSIFSPPAAEDTDESTDCVGLPARGRHDLGQRRSFGALNHRDHSTLLVGPIRSRFAGSFLGPGRVLRSLGPLRGFAAGLGLRSAKVLRRGSLRIDCVVLMVFSWTGLPSSINQPGRNSTWNLKRLSNVENLAAGEPSASAGPFY
jgi:hypothetical protein